MSDPLVRHDLARPVEHSLVPLRPQTATERARAAITAGQLRRARIARMAISRGRRRVRH